MENAEQIAEEDRNYEGEEEHKLKHHIEIMSDLSKEVKTSDKKLKKIDRILTQSIDKKRKLIHKSKKKIRETNKKIEQNKQSPKKAEKLEERLDKNLEKITIKTYKRIQKIATKINFASITQEMEDIEKKIGEEIEKILEAEAQEANAYKKGINALKNAAKKVKQKVVEHSGRISSNIRKKFGN